MLNPNQDHDSPWKEGLEVFFQAFLELLFPDIAQHIDWQYAPTYLDKELQKVTHQGQTGRRHVDKLLKLHSNDRTQTSLLIHIEVQGHAESGFAERMFNYFQRIRDRYKHPVLSLAVLTDTRTDFRPNHFLVEHYGCRLDFRFRVCKLLDLCSHHSSLLEQKNPFALLLAAQWVAKQTPDAHKRADHLVRLHQNALRLNLNRPKTLRLITLLEWMLQLPESLLDYYEHQLRQLQESENMSYITLIERKGIKKGIEQGMEKGMETGRLQGQAMSLIHLLTFKFGSLPDEIRNQIHQADASSLDNWLKRTLQADSLDNVIVQ